MRPAAIKIVSRIREVFTLKYIAPTDTLLVEVVKFIERTETLIAKLSTASEAPSPESAEHRIRTAVLRADDLDAQLRDLKAKDAGRVAKINSLKAELRVAHDEIDNAT